MALVRHLLKSELLKGSFLIFIAGNVGNLGNFLYSLSMVRLLGPEIYGELGSILSLFSLLAVPLSILSLVVVKTVSSFYGRGEFDKLASFLRDQQAKVLLIGVSGAVLIISFGPVIQNFLKLDSFLPILFLGMIFLVGGLSTVNKGALQGTLAFPSLTINSIAEVVIKLVLSVVLVYFGLQLAGALAGPVLAALAGYLLASWQLRKIRKNAQNKGKTPLAAIWREAFSPVFLTTLTLTIFFTMDVVLVRHFFTAVEAGEYAALANLGKVGYYIVGPIMMVMFPLISARVTSGRSYLLPLLGSLVLSLGASLGIIFVFLFFGQQIINLLYGQKYLGAVPYLSLYSFYMAIYGLNAILTYFILSISYYRPVFILFIISLLQGVLIFFFHQSIFRVIGVNIIISALYLLVITVFILWKLKSKSTNFL